MMIELSLGNILSESLASKQVPELSSVVFSLKIYFLNVASGSKTSVFCGIGVNVMFALTHCW